MNKTKPNISVPAVVPKLKTGDDAEVKETFKHLFLDAQNGLRRVVAFGLYAWQVKLLKLKHGQFGAWVEGNYAGDGAGDNGCSYRSVRAHMQMTESALHACGIKNVKNFLSNQIGNALPNSHCGEFLLLPDSKIPDKIKPLREKIFSIIDGKSARQLFAEFKQTDEDGSDFPKPKRGRRKGEGGNSAEHLAKVRAAEEKARIEAIELESEDFCKWIDEHCDEKGLGLINDKAFETLCDRAELLWNFCRQLRDARRPGRVGQKGGAR